MARLEAGDAHFILVISVMIQLILIELYKVIKYLNEVLMKCFLN